MCSTEIGDLGIENKASAAPDWECVCTWWAMIHFVSHFLESGRGSINRYSHYISVLHPTLPTMHSHYPRSCSVQVVFLIFLWTPVSGKLFQITSGFSSFRIWSASVFSKECGRCLQSNLLLINMFQDIKVGNSAKLLGFLCYVISCTLISRFKRHLILRLWIHLLYCFFACIVQAKNY